MVRRAIVIVFAVVLASGWALWAGPAWAVDGGKADPTGDVFDTGTQKYGPGHLDVVKVSHHDDGTRAAYTVRTAHQWVTTDLAKVFLNIESLPGLPQYDCQQVSAVVVQKSGKLEGNLTQCFGSGSGQEGGPGGFKRLGPVIATHDENTDTITLSFELSALRDAGFKGRSYNYNIVMEEKIEPEKWDKVPNDDGSWITHTFDAPATPIPRPVVATPVSTVAPTPVRTLDPTVAPTPAATDADALSFSAPGERTDADGMPSTPLRVAAIGSVVAGAGVALVRFWPF